MIKIEVSTDLFTRILEVGDDSNPSSILDGLVEKGWRWQLDLSQASDRERAAWVRADLMARIIAALLEGRAVWFQGAKHSATNRAALDRVIGEVEDAIAESGFSVRVESDDEQGVRIGTGPK